MDETQDLQAEVDQLRRRLDDVENEQQRTKSLIEQFQEGAISRRTFLAAVGGAAGVTALASNARAAPSWGSASGQLGTQSEPLNKVISQDVRAQSVDTKQVTRNRGFSGKSAELSEGGPLNEEITNLLSNGYNHIRLHQKKDGSRWQLNKRLLLDPTKYGGIRIEADKNAEIDCNDGPFPLDIRPPNISSQVDGQNFEVVGGEWYNQITNPDGWLRGKDAYRLKAVPHRVNGFRNSSNTGRGVVAENVDYWSESWLVGGKYDVDIGIDTVPASITGGTGTDSFDDWEIRSPIIHQTEIGMRFRGGVRHGAMVNPTTFQDADGATGFLLDGDLKGTTFMGIKVDNPGGYNNTTGIKTGANYERPPVFVETRIISATQVSRGSSSDVVPVLQGTNTSSEAMKVGDLGNGEMQIGRHSFSTGRVEREEITFNMADDSAVQFDGAGVKSVAVLGDRAHPEHGMFGTVYGTLTTYGQSGMSNEGNGTLSGTTGPDGTLNISRDANTIYLENRTGGQREVTVLNSEQEK